MADTTARGAPLTPPQLPPYLYIMAHVLSLLPPHISSVRSSQPISDWLAVERFAALVTDQVAVTVEEDVGVVIMRRKNGAK